jgi:hypothetical protein
MKTVTGLFDNYEAAKDAVARLENAGFPSDDISIVSHHRDDDSESNAGSGAGVGAGLGAAVGGAGGLLTGLGFMAIPGVGPVVAAGWLAATLTGAVGGAVVGGVVGGLIGALTESGVSEEDAHLYAEGVLRMNVCRKLTLFWPVPIRWISMPDANSMSRKAGNGSTRTLILIPKRKSNGNVAVIFKS